MGQSKVSEEGVQELNMTLSKRAREIREKRNLSLRALSELMKEEGFTFSISKLSLLERGGIGWNISHLAAYSAAFGISIADLFGAEFAESPTGLSIEESALLASWRTAGPAGVMSWLVTKLPAEGP